MDSPWVNITFQQLYDKSQIGSGCVRDAADVRLSELCCGVSMVWDTNPVEGRTKI